MPSNPYFPSLSNLIKGDKLPAIGDLRERISTQLQHLGYDNLQREVSSAGDTGAYCLSIRTSQPIGFTIPGTDLEFIINPDSGISIFPITLSYQLPGLRLLPELSSSNIQNDPLVVFNLLLDILGISGEEFLSELINVFIGTSDAIGDFISAYNTLHSATPIVSIVDDNPEVVIADLAQQISTQADLFGRLYQDFIAVGDLHNIGSNIKKVLSKYFDDASFDYIKTLFTPRIDASLKNLAFGIKFPTNVFRQLDDDPNSSTYLQPLSLQGNDVPAILKFDVGS